MLADAYQGKGSPGKNHGSGQSQDPIVRITENHARRVAEGNRKKALQKFKQPLNRIDRASERKKGYSQETDQRDEKEAADDPDIIGHRFQNKADGENKNRKESQS